MNYKKAINNFPSLHLYIIIGALAALLFIPFLGQVHLFDWDENNFAEAAREMIISGNYLQVQINFEPFYEKPPLFFWLQTLSMKIFGINEFAARFPNAITGVITLLLIFHIGRKLYDNLFGVLWVLAYIGSFLPHFYFKTGIIDPVFNLFIFLGIYFLAKNSMRKSYAIADKSSYRYRNAALSGVFIGLAILTKGPVGFLIPFLCFLIFAIINRFKKIVQWKEVLVWLVSAIVVASLWFGVDLIVNGPQFIQAFIIRQWELLTTGDAGHGQPFYYHFIVILIGCFPASILMIKGHRKLHLDTFSQIRFHQWMIILFWVVLILFSLVKTKIIHYSSLTYLPLTFLAAHFLYGLKSLEYRWNRMITAALALLGLLWAMIFILIPVIGQNTSEIIPMINDPFAVANLSADVGWKGWEIGIGILYLAIVAAAIALIVYHNYLRGVVTLFIAGIIAMQLTFYIIIPKVEEYVQGAAIRFYQQAGDEKANIQVLGFRSYGFLFYGRSDSTMNNSEMLNNTTTAPDYFVAKSPDARHYIDQYNLQKVKEENGYVLMKKESE